MPTYLGAPTRIKADLNIRENEQRKPQMCLILPFSRVPELRFCFSLVITGDPEKVSLCLPAYYNEV